MLNLWSCPRVSIDRLTFRTFTWLDMMAQSVNVNNFCSFVIGDFHCDGTLNCLDSPLSLPPRL